MVFSYLLTV